MLVNKNALDVSDGKLYLMSFQKAYKWR